MDEPGRLAEQVGPLITLLGSGLMFFSIFKVIRAGAMQQNNSGPLRDRAGRKRLRESLDLPEPIPAEEIAALQSVARTMMAWRWWLWFPLGASLAQIGGTLGHRGPVRLVLVAAFLVFMALASVLVEQQARLGASFLQRYPVAEQHPTG
jgi:hypothetical protein